jgi:hypothetical protein
MKNVLKLWLCAWLLLVAGPIQAQDADQPQDAKGCKDSPLVTRVPGSTISFL